MRYVRTFRLQAAHFNMLESYRTAWELFDGANPDTSRILAALHDVHGHNFRIDVSVEGKQGDRPWLIDDVKLARIVMEWDNVNLSMHFNFMAKRTRATTENMARILLRKLNALFSADGVHIERVRVYETDDIYAEATTEDGDDLG